MRRRVSAVCLVLAGGCSNEMSMLSDKGAFDTAWADADSADTGFDEEDAVEPVWWRLDAAVSLAMGTPDASSSRLSLTLIAADGLELCGDTLGVDEILDVGTLPDEAIFAWWQISSAEPAGDCAPWRSPVPEPVLLGVGAMDANIQANLSPAGLANLEDNLNASYASLDGGDTLYVFGVAGTDTAWLDVDEAAEQGPVEDGTWIIKAIYPFSY